jgi:hypothetical protein
MQILKGTQFYFWTVTETFNGSTKDPLSRIKCQCICGTTKEHYYNVLKYRSKSCGCQSQSLKQATFIQNYGTSHPLKSNLIQEKIKNTLLVKYGVTNISLIPASQDKKKATFIERFGETNPQKNAHIREKTRKTCLEKYGTETPFQNEIIKQQIKRQHLNKHGVEHHNQLSSRRMILNDWCIANVESLYTSKAETQLLFWIRESYPSAAKSRNSKWELDIYIPELSLGIEFNGLYFHNEKYKKAHYHLNKTNYFKEQKIRVIHVWEHEWKFRKEQVKSFLWSALGKNENKIGARKCCVVWSNSKEEIEKAHQLLNTTHIQGSIRTTKYVTNIYYQDTLVATATFGKHHRDSKTWVLTRFTTKTNYTIQGILSRISKLASKELQSDIISWADHRLSNGNGYKKAGWVQEELLKPDYFYHKGLQVYSKQSRQKKLVKTQKSMTEKEHALQDGLLRIYDCGKIRFRFKY